ncbi:MAG TPA: glycoside hydrolase family 30 beta sandwich domain-containing protein, partial [Terriglobales bacterium]|nr:glycoside hydrolase family 30 beta sandwich domain-containing protein [Terriglobales bacterium]
FALDEHGKPNIGPFNCGGLVQVHSQTKELAYCGQYWAFAHYSRFVKREARRFDSQSTNSDLLHVAFENPNGGRVVVLTNPGPAQNCELRLGNQSTSVKLDQNSVTTLQWS